ncbi:hypothetical protein Ae406Ps2_1411 [Pseudonocardia sp. Ae406_Ps2]|nr:hypothetical protein Ae406Ps2_1411 [Pseudonocardia sp. Ae406_Ps2]OLM06792.1 hypothetical protein Ae331Ps2_4502c [Pseudonocardia sp. Ae331_Ps2]
MIARPIPRRPAAHLHGRRPPGPPPAVPTVRALLHRRAVIRPARADPSRAR